MNICTHCKRISLWRLASLTIGLLLLVFLQVAWVVKSNDTGTSDQSTTLSGLVPGFLKIETERNKGLEPDASSNRFNPFTRRLALLADWLVWMAAATYLFVLPGWVLLRILLPAWVTLDFWEKILLGSGVGLSLQFLLFLWTDLIGVHLGAAYAWAPGGLALLAILWLNYNSLRALFSRERRTRLPGWDWWLTGLVFGLVISIRFIAIRGLTVPMWGDSVQHTTIAQLILDQGGLFHSWLPYTPYTTLTTHYGFSAGVALFSWLVSIDSLQATLVTGQVLNSLAVLCLYPLAVRLANGNRMAGIGTVIVAGLLFRMPAYYVNYGRYAQLTGQVILPTALWLLWETMNPRPGKASPEKTDIFRHLLLAAIAVAGMFLGYYRTPFFYATFGVFLFLFGGLPRWKKAGRSMFKGISVLFLLAVGSLLLLLPWLPRLTGSNLADAVGAGITKGKQLELVWIDFQGWRDIAFYAPWGLLVLAGAAFLWALVRRRWLIAALGLWFPLLAIYLFGSILGLPGANMLQTFALLISVYIPVSMLVGWSVGELDDWLKSINRLAPVFLSLVLLVVGIWGWTSQINIAEPDIYNMVEKQDLKAAKWMRAHTPPDAIVLIEGFSIYSGTSAVGSDAGWWLPIIAGRQTNIPPQYAQFNEQPLTPGYTKQVADLVISLEQQPLTAPDNLQRLCSFGITHVYIGQKQGKVGYNAPQLFSPDQLLASPDFKLIYHKDQVYIFEFVACEVKP